MIFSLAEVLLLCMLVDWLFRACRLPGFVGMLLVGFTLGPGGLNRLDPSLLHIGIDLRILALMVIVLRAGFALRPSVIRALGLPLLFLCFVPSLIEAAIISTLSRHLLGFTWPEALMLGFIIPAVSPAVVVPLMIQYIEEKRGHTHRVPSLVLAASSLDNIFNVLMADLMIRQYAQPSSVLPSSLASIPLSLGLGLLLGFLLGQLLIRLFEIYNPRATKRTLLVVTGGLLLYRLEKVMAGSLSFSALLAVLVMGCVILERRERFAREISAKLNKIWIFAEIALFSVVGAQFNLTAALSTGLTGILLIVTGLAGRISAVFACLAGALPWGERLFAAAAFVPKASVQAALAGIPLSVMISMQVNPEPGEKILALSVLSILLTAPLGAWLTRTTAERFLPPEQDVV
ncbi:MAG TPA: cation:proton antiporter [Candidatus Ozemobacteraceae bacterium]|nr:cation:proton antiporter [Candidatus Ozemobacteraceae bacterium]